MQFTYKHLAVIIVLHHRTYFFSGGSSLREKKIDIVNTLGCSIEIANYLDVAVQSKLNILIVGSKQINKNKLLKVLTELVNKNSQIIIIDSGKKLELVDTDHHYYWPMEKSLYSKDVLIQMAGQFYGKMRCIVDQIEDAEVGAFMNLLANGFTGSMTTFDCNHPRLVISKLLLSYENSISEETGIVSNRYRSLEIATNLDLIIEVNHETGGTSVIDQMYDVSVGNKGKYIMRPLIDQQTLLDIKPSFDYKRMMFCSDLSFL